MEILVRENAEIARYFEIVNNKSFKKMRINDNHNG